MVSNMSNKTKVPKLYRQGDVLIMRVDGVPDGAKEEPRDGDLILQHGEVTGHAHRISSRHATMYRSEEDRRFMKVGGAPAAPVELKHEEHATVTIPRGVYEVTIHAEYVPGAVPRQVAD